MAQYVSNNLAGGTLVLSKPGTAAGTTTTLTTAATTVYAIKGYLYSKAASANTATPTVDITTSKAFEPVLPGKGCLFVFSWDSAGALACSQGPISDGATGYQFPPVPTTHAPFAVVKVVSASNGPVGGFAVGTSNLSGVTGVTYTFYDLFAMPVMPLM